MSEDRELRDALEATQRRLKQAESTMADIERRRALAEQRNAEFERQVEADGKRLAELEERLRLTAPGNIQTEISTVRTRLETLEQRLKQVDAVSPRLPTGGVCSRCGSAQLVGRAELQLSGGDAGGTLNAVVHRKPGATFFKETVSVEVWAAVCGQCGAVELSTDSARHLFDAWSTKSW